MVIVVLGGGISKNGILPEHVISRLEKAKEVFDNADDSRIVLSGRYSFLYPKDQLPQITESQKMKETLVQMGINEDKMFIEDSSMDTIGNAYYLKTNYFIPENVFKAVIISSEFHIERVRYIFEKVFGDEYIFEYAWPQSILSDEKKEEVVAHQKEVLEKIKIFLHDMEDGDHSFLKDELYKNKYYTEPRPREVIDFVTQGK